MLIECKAGRSFLGKDRKKELLSLSEQAGAPVVLARRRKRAVQLTKLADGQPLDPKNLLGAPSEGPEVSRSSKTRGEPLQVVRPLLSEQG